MVGNRKAIESLYNGVCDVFEYKSVKFNTTKLTNTQEVCIHSAVPCRLSYKSIANATTSDTVSTVTQQIKLFIAPELDIKAGCKITVTQNGRTVEYKSGGQPAVYTSHQEIVLELFKGWC